MMTRILTRGYLWLLLALLYSPILILSLIHILSIVSIDQKGTDACVKFQAARNEGGDRSTSITFRTTDGKKDYTSKTELSQQGAIVEATVAEFIAAEVGATQYRCV